MLKEIDRVCLFSQLFSTTPTRETHEIDGKRHRLSRMWKKSFVGHVVSYSFVSCIANLLRFFKWTWSIEVNTLWGFCCPPLSSLRCIIIIFHSNMKKELCWRRGELQLDFAFYEILLFISVYMNDSSTSTDPLLSLIHSKS